jgi:hypothetical protein
MCAYNIAKACPASVLCRNNRQQTPVEVAVACERGEVRGACLPASLPDRLPACRLWPCLADPGLSRHSPRGSLSARCTRPQHPQVLNAMLLACAGDASEVAVRAMKRLLQQGAVPDTWAPNGSSALMLAASCNGTAALQVLLQNGASIELQDALGRTALMFAAGNCACETLQVRRAWCCWAGVCWAGAAGLAPAGLVLLGCLLCSAVHQQRSGCRRRHLTAIHLPLTSPHPCGRRCWTRARASRSATAAAAAC